MTLLWTRATVTQRHVWEEGLFTLTVEAPQVLPFEPGQFLQLGLEIEGQHVHRPYSVASPHGAKLEFYIVRVESGALTPHLWRLGVGDQLEVSEKAAGRFTLEHAPEGEDLYLVATGTGLAPYVAMLRTDGPWRRYPRIVLIHGARHASDLSYAEEWRRHAQTYGDRFKYVPVASREAIAGGLQGRIPKLLESGELEQFIGRPISPETSAWMLCGNPAMLDDMEAGLVSRGLKRHRSKSPGQIVVERYW